MELVPGRAGCWARGQDRAQGPEGDLSEAQTLTPGRCGCSPAGAKGNPRPTPVSASISTVTALCPDTGARTGAGCAGAEDANAC